jgi:tetratricopeptide (TPR) repeat protein
MDQQQAQRKEFLSGMKVALELLKSDLALLQEKYELFDVVDFAAMYAHVYKTPGLPILSLKDESEAVVAARAQMALQLLFSEYPRRLLVIPPYSDELRNHLTYRNSTLQQATMEAMLAQREHLARMIEKSEAFQAFNSQNPDERQAVQTPSSESTDHDHELARLPDTAVTSVLDDDTAVNTFLEASRSTAADSKQRSAALRVAKEFFPELYAVTVEQGQGSFTSLYRNKRVIDSDADEALPMFRDLEYKEETVDRWFNSINAKRNGKRAFQTRTDALACTYIEQANARMNKDRKVVLFISPSASVSKALSDSSLLSGGIGSELPVVRDLTYCMMAAAHKGSFEEQDAKIKENLGIVGRLLEVYESTIPVSWQARQKREQAALDWKRCENFFLASKTLIADTVARTARNDRESRFLRVIAELHSTDSNGRKRLLQELENDREKLNEDITELNKLIPALDADSTYHKYRLIHQETVAQGLRVKFPGLPDEAPFKLTFHERRAMGAAEYLRRLSEKVSQDAMLALRPDILDIASQPDATPEDHLLAGYLLAMEGRYEMALGELNAGLAKAGNQPVSEIRFVTSIVLRKLNRSREAVELLEKALTSTSADFRLYLEMANALWLNWHERPNAMHVHPELNEAIKRLQEAERAVSAHGIFGQADVPARALIANMTVFVRTERALALKGKLQISDLEKAGLHVDTMFKALPQELWMSRFFDTFGYWQYAKAKTLPMSAADKKQLLESAASYVNKALATEEDFASGIRIRQEHKELIERELAGMSDSGDSYAVPIPEVGHPESQAEASGAE